MGNRETPRPVPIVVPDKRRKLPKGLKIRSTFVERSLSGNPNKACVKSGRMMSMATAGYKAPVAPQIIKG